LDFVQVVDFGPNLVKADELNDDLLGFLHSFQIGLGVVLDFMLLLGDCLLDFGTLQALALILELLLDFFQVVKDIFGVMQLLGFEVPFEEGSL